MASKPSLRLVDRISPFVHRFLAIRFRQRLAKAAHCQPSIRAFRNVVRALNPHLASHWLKVINCRTTRRDARLFKPLQSACSNSLVVLGPSRHRRHLSQKDNPFIGHIELILANPRSMKRRDFMTLIGGGGVPARGIKTRQSQRLWRTSCREAFFSCSVWPLRCAIPSARRRSTLVTENGLGRRSQRRDRVSLGGRDARALCRAPSFIAQAGRRRPSELNP